MLTLLVVSTHVWSILALAVSVAAPNSRGLLASPEHQELYKILNSRHCWWKCNLLIAKICFGAGSISSNKLKIYIGFSLDLTKHYLRTYFKSEIEFDKFTRFHYPILCPLCMCKIILSLLQTVIILGNSNFWNIRLFELHTLSWSEIILFRMSYEALL